MSIHLLSMGASYAPPAAPAGQVFTETWSGFSVGNTEADMTAAGAPNTYTGDGAQTPAVLIETDGWSGGKRASFTGTTNNNWYKMSRDQITTALVAAGTGWTSIEALVGIRTFDPGATTRAGFGIRFADFRFSGLYWYMGNGAAANYLEIISRHSGVATSTSLAPTIAVDQTRWVRLRWTKGPSELRARTWLMGDGEPGTWGVTLTDPDADWGSIPLLCPYQYNTTAKGQFLGYRVAIDTTASEF